MYNSEVNERLFKYWVNSYLSMITKTDKHSCVDYKTCEKDFYGPYWKILQMKKKQTIYNNKCNLEEPVVHVIVIFLVVPASA